MSLGWSRVCVEHNGWFQSCFKRQEHTRNAQDAHVTVLSGLEARSAGADGISAAFGVRTGPGVVTQVCCCCCYV